MTVVVIVIVKKLRSRNLVLVNIGILDKNIMIPHRHCVNSGRLSILRITHNIYIYF